MPQVEPFDSEELPNSLMHSTVPGCEGKGTSPRNTIEKNALPTGWPTVTLDSSHQW